MARNPELRDFERRTLDLSNHNILKGVINGDELRLDVPGGNIDPQIYPYAQPPTPLLPLLQIEGEIAYEGRNKLVHGAYEWSSFPSTSVAR